MKVLIIPEDPTYDQYIVKPIVERLLQDVGLTGRVDVLRDPKLDGIDQALDKEVLAGIVSDNPMEDLFVLVVDRDCERMNDSARTAARAARLAPLTRLMGPAAGELYRAYLVDLYERLGAREQARHAHLIRGLTPRVN